VPAVAAIREELALFVFIGSKAFVGGILKELSLSHLNEIGGNLKVIDQFC